MDAMENPELVLHIIVIVNILIIGVIYMYRYIPIHYSHSMSKLRPFYLKYVYNILYFVYAPKCK